MSNFARQGRFQLGQLRARLMLPIEGDVSQREAPDGLYDDRWASPELRFMVEAGRNLSGFAVFGMLPEWWPSQTAITIDVNGQTRINTIVEPGPFELVCRAPLQAGASAVITIRTSVTAYDGERERHLGVYIGIIRFLSVGAAGFQCNICGTQNEDLDPAADPEGSLCIGCGSNIRLRALAHLVGDALFGRLLTVYEFPRTAAVGLGVSDSPGFEGHMKRAVPNYLNTQFDRALVSKRSPFLDITDPEPRFVSAADFITCSEVLEHVEPPVQRSFDGLCSLLRPGGTLVLTVPYTLQRTVEHFPDLHDWQLEQRGTSRVLVNRTRDGQLQQFENLCFHGGGASVLEMRVFGLEDILTHLEAAGFTDIRVRGENVLQHGIFFKYNWGLPITARRPE